MCHLNGNLLAVVKLILLFVGQITQESSIFTYPPGMGAENFSFPNHVPVFLDDVLNATTPEILTACGNDPQCVFDYTATGNMEIGLGTLAANENNTRDQEEACKTYRSYRNCTILQKKVDLA